VNWVVFNECCYRTFFSKCVTVSYLKLNVWKKFIAFSVLKE
jgi:hypothetical protein